MAEEIRTKPPLLILSGPTAVGKSSLAIALAKRIGGEILSVDSMQVYKGMDIGTAKIRPEEMGGIPHFGLDLVGPDENFDVASFQTYAYPVIRGILHRGHIPILVGGTGFYIQAVLYGIDFSDRGPDMAYRDSLYRMAEEEGRERVHDLLKEIDPPSYQSIHPNNLQRTVRALEYYHETGEAFSSHNAREKKRQSPFSFLYLVLTRDRGALYQAIDHRVDEMIRDGLLDEIDRLKNMGLTFDKDKALHGIGYREFFTAGEEEPLSQIIDRIKEDSRHYAKRQLTWFRREKETTWINVDDYPGEEEKVGKILSLLPRDFDI